MAAPEPMPDRPLRVLFSMRNFWYVRIFESVIRELANRGHAVHICAEFAEGKAVAREWTNAAAALAQENANISFSWTPRHVEDDWVDLRIMVHLGLDYLRFLEPEYSSAPMLADRARDRTPDLLVHLAEMRLLRAPGGRRILAWILRTIERAIPYDPELARYIKAHQPDVILISPLLTLGSEQQDVLRMARRLGVPSVLCVGSWDHLSSKALVRQLPDRVIVWNDTQRQEAVTMHGMPPEVVTVTGAQCFDQWFDRRPALDREAFCRKVGLDPGRPYILYVCSALFEGSPSEAEWVVRWITALRESGDPRLQAAGILVRQHPKRGFEWDEVDVSGLAGVSVWPPRATAPFHAESKADYFDSLFHSAVVVGLNTSALIEAGIVGRAVHTLLLPEFESNQEGTLHFRYLLEQGLLRSTRDVPSHLVQLSESLATADPNVHHNRAFVEAFVRPHGITVPAAPVFASAVEAAAHEAAVPARQPWWLSAVRLLLTPLALHTRGTFADQVHRERQRRVRTLTRQRERAEALARREALKQGKRAARDARVLEARAVKQARRAQRQQVQRQEHSARQAMKRRQQRRDAINARMAEYYRRLIRPFSAHR